MPELLLLSSLAVLVITWLAVAMLLERRAVGRQRAAYKAAFSGPDTDWLAGTAAGQGEALRTYIRDKRATRRAADPFALGLAAGLVAFFGYLLAWGWFTGQTQNLALIALVGATSIGSVLVTWAWSRRR